MTFADRRALRGWLVAATMLAACGDDSSPTDAGTLDASVDAYVPEDAGTPDAFTPACELGESAACTCAGGVPGTQLCLDDQSGFDACACDTYGANVFVVAGATEGDGSADAPFGTLEEAQTAVRELIAAGLPEGGVAVWLQGTFVRTATLELGAADSGDATHPVVWRGYPGQTVRISGGLNVDPSAFVAVDSSSAVWSRLDTDAREHIVALDLSELGISDFGSLSRRGVCANVESSPLEVFIDDEPGTLARWPDRDHGLETTGATISLHGSVTPDVSGSYTQTGAGLFQRDALVDGAQYYLRSLELEVDGAPTTAWFVTTSASGDPDTGAPWWAVYDEELRDLSPGNGAAGILKILADDALSEEFSYVGAVSSTTVFNYSGDRPSRWTAAEDLWLHGWWKHLWADCRMAADVDTANQRITLSSADSYGLEEGRPFYAFNLLEEITVPGEYYLDRNAGILYLYPIEGMERVTLSRLADDVIRLSSAQFIELRDLVVEAGRAKLIYINGGSDNLVEGVTLRNGGATGIHMVGSRHGFRGGEIAHTATNGALMHGGDRPSLTLGENFVEDSHIHHFGRTEWLYRSGVRMSGAGNRAEHNLIHSSPHAAVLFGGNEHSVSHNEIHDVCQYSGDAGAIYTGRDWGYHGNEVNGNFVHHIISRVKGSAGVHGVYLDDCASGIEVQGNVFYAVSGHSVQHGGGRDDIMENNIMVGGRDAVYADHRCYSLLSRGIPNTTPGSSWNFLEKLNQMNYQSDPWASAYPSVAAIPNDWNVIIASGSTWLFPEGSTFDRNLGFALELFMRKSGEPFDHYASVADNVEDAAPLFVDEARLDLRLQDGSPALAIPGWEAIDFANIGPRD